MQRPASNCENPACSSPSFLLLQHPPKTCSRWYTHKSTDCQPKSQITIQSRVLLQHDLVYFKTRKKYPIILKLHTLSISNFLDHKVFGIRTIPVLLNNPPIVIPKSANHSRGKPTFNDSFYSLQTDLKLEVTQRSTSKFITQHLCNSTYERFQIINFWAKANSELSYSMQYYNRNMKN